ncbi:hypothetical protein Pint_10935 [Pistacia integerrima]|uniref:Uncharacterized protein n=1 Tax=Pistacia integerrima TaxID=434235 RepID=A0ACC0XKY3_9ROSI|nr:hypothetical protein Pint_10935 [Pistacia integerrima]
MEFPTYQYQPSPWHYLLTSPAIFSYPIIPQNYVHWTQTPESHIFSADLPGVRKEEIKVEVEDSIYLIIRTEAIDESRCPFMRKFRLPGMVNIDSYEDGVFRVSVPRRGFFIHPLELLARAA